MNNKREYKLITVVVRFLDAVTEKETGKVIKTIDSRERREWLNKQIMWGVMNKKIVEVVNKDDDKDGEG